MTNLEKYQLSIYERCEAGSITEEERDILLESAPTDELVEEAVSPIKEFKSKIEEIKKQKPTEYSDDTEVKKFIDDNHEIISKAAKILEKEPKELRKQDMKNLCLYVLSMIAYIAGGSLLGTAPIIVSVALMIVPVITMIITCIISYLRTNDDQEVYNNLMKIKNSLKKVKNNDKLPDNYKKKINELIVSIDDAEEEISARLKVHKESVTEYKLSVYERCERGEISEEERDVLLESLTVPNNNDDNVDELADENNEYITSIYERCESGSITEEERDILLEAANETNRQYLQALRKLNREFALKEKEIKTSIKVKDYGKAKELISDAEELLDDMVDELKEIPEDIEDAVIAQVTSALSNGLTMGIVTLILTDLKSAIKSTVEWGLFTGFLNTASSVWSYNKGESFNLYRKRLVKRLNENRRVLSNLRNKVLKKEMKEENK